MKLARDERRGWFGGKPTEQPSHYWERPSRKDMAKRIWGRGANYIETCMVFPRPTDVRPTHDDDEIYDAPDGLAVIHDTIALLAWL